MCDVIFDLTKDNIEDYWFRFNDSEQSFIIERLNEAVEQHGKITIDIRESHFYDDLSFSIESTDIDDKPSYQEPKELLQIIEKLS